MFRQDKRRLLEFLERRDLLAGDLPTFDDGVFALPGSPDTLIDFEIRRTDDAVSADDDAMLVGFVTDDATGSLDSIRSPERYEIKALARARQRVLYFGAAEADYKLNGGSFLSFGLVKTDQVTDWLKATTRQVPEPDLGFLFSVEDHEIGDVRSLGNQEWELQWGDPDQLYTFELVFDTPEFEADVRIESLVNSDPADDAPGISVDVGDFVSRNYAVSNPGAVSLVDMRVVDDNGTPGDLTDDFEPAPNLVDDGLNLGDLDRDRELDPGEVWVYSSPHTARAGQYSSTATVTATGQGQALTADDTANYFGSNPEAVDLALAGIGITPDPSPNEASGIVPLLKVGETYAFSPVVLNTGVATVEDTIEVRANYRGASEVVSTDDDLAAGTDVVLAPIEITEQQEGVFAIELILDPEDRIAEDDESAVSNQQTLQVEFVKTEVAIVDFVATPTPLDRTEVGEEPTYDVGQTYEIRPVVTNTGRLTESGPIEVEVIYRDQRTTVSTEESVLAGQSVTLDPVAITELQAGQYLIQFVLDPDNRLDESDESDDSNLLTEMISFA